jgi:hypothetical protein
MIQKNRDYKLTTEDDSFVKNWGQKRLENFPNFAKCYREKFRNLASSFTG